MNREEFLRQMGLSTDDVADPETIVANLKEQRQRGGAPSAQASYFSRPRDKPYPGFASATPAATQQTPMSEEGQKKYDDYVNRRVENVTSNKTDEADEAYMPKNATTTTRTQASVPADPSAGGSKYSTPTTAGPARSSSRKELINKSDSTSSYTKPTTSTTSRGGGDWVRESGNDINNNDYDTADDGLLPTASTSAAPTKPKINTTATTANSDVARRIAQSSKAFYGAGESDEEDDERGMMAAKKQQQHTPTSLGGGGGGPSGQSRAEFLKSLGIDNVTASETAAGGGGGKSAYGASSSSTQREHDEAIASTVALTGASRTEALSQAVAQRRAQRKAAALAASKANGGVGDVDEYGAYQPPRSAPSAVTVETNTTPTSAGNASKNTSLYNTNAAATMMKMPPRASSEPSGDQQQLGGGTGVGRSTSRATAPRVTIASTVTSVPAPRNYYKDDDDEDDAGGAGYRHGGGGGGASRPSGLNPSRVAANGGSSGAYTTEGGLATPSRPSRGGGSNPTSPTNSSKLRESPTQVVNDILFGGGGGGRGVGGGAARGGGGGAIPPQQPPYYSRGRGGNADYNSSATSSLNNTMNSTTGTANTAEYDPETAHLGAEELKNLGNRAFESGDFRKAVRFYSKAIGKDASNPALYSNRSAAYLQAAKQMGMDTRSMALRDAEKTVELSPNWFKGYSRKGDALFKMERYDDAIDAYEAGLALDEGNPSLIHSIGEARNANGGIARRDKKDTPWAHEQRTTVDIKSQYGTNKSAHELNDLNRGVLNEALGTLVMGDDYRRQQLERFKTQKEAGGSGGSGGGSGALRASGTQPAAPARRASPTPTAAAADSSTTSKPSSTLLDMIRSNSPKDNGSGIPLNPSHGRRAGGGGGGAKEPLPEMLTSDAAMAYQDSLRERYLARKAAAAAAGPGGGGK